MAFGRFAEETSYSFSINSSAPCTLNSYLFKVLRCIAKLQRHSAASQQRTYRSINAYISPSSNAHTIKGIRVRFGCLLTPCVCRVVLVMLRIWPGHGQKGESATKNNATTNGTRTRRQRCGSLRRKAFRVRVPYTSDTNLYILYGITIA